MIKISKVLRVVVVWRTSKAFKGVENVPTDAEPVRLLYEDGCGIWAGEIEDSKSVPCGQVRCCWTGWNAFDGEGPIINSILHTGA